MARIIDTTSLQNHKKIQAALQLLLEDTTSSAKFENIRTLLKGINPTIDKNLSQCSTLIKQIRNMQEGELIELAAQNAPATTEKQKKRKKLLLLLFSFWRDLRTEVKRASDEYEKQNNDGNLTTKEHVSTIRKLMTFAKGPFGITTLLAIVIAGGVFFVNSKIVSVTIANQGCDPLIPPAKLAVSIPGIQIPSEPITNGTSATMKIPAVTVSVDVTENSINVSFMDFSATYNLQGVVSNILFNNTSLLGKQTTIDLSTSKTHTVVIKCLTE